VAENSRQQNQVGPGSQQAMSLTAAASGEIRRLVKVVHTRKENKHCGVFVADDTAPAVVRHLLQPDLCRPLSSAAVIKDSQKELKVGLNVCVKAGVEVNKDALARKGEATREAKKAINIKVNLA
jgi:hypothetical protein